MVFNFLLNLLPKMERGTRTLFKLKHYVEILRFHTKNQPLMTRSNLKLAPLGMSTDSSVKNSNKYCWKCGILKTNILDLFCEKCHIIQSPPQKNNYFKVLGVQEEFNIDQKRLKNVFRKFQSLIHPDKFSNSTHEEQTISEEYSSLINKAYTNLASPMKRAEHLLYLNGESIGESQTIDEPSFLMQIMAMNEEVEAAEQDIEKLQKLNEKNKNELETLTKEIDHHFRNLNIEAAKKAIIKLKYFASISNRIHSIFREKGIIDD